MPQEGGLFPQKWLYESRQNYIIKNSRLLAYTVMQEQTQKKGPE